MRKNLKNNPKRKNEFEIPEESLRVGVVQMTSGEDVSQNVETVLQAFERLRSRRCDLICLPENVLFFRGTGTIELHTFNLKERFWGTFQEYADANECMIFFGSIPLRVRSHRVNATVLVRPQKKPQVVYEKIHLFDANVEGAPVQRESDLFKHGAKPKLLSHRGWNIGLSICYDVRFAELYAYYARKNAHLILVPAAFLVPTGRDHWQVLLRARAIESQAYVVAAAQCGKHGSVQGQQRETYGHSLVADPWGRL